VIVLSSPLRRRAAARRVREVALRVLIAGALLAGAPAACRTGALDAAVQAAALRAIFVERGESNARLVVWDDGAHAGPVLAALGEPLVAPLAPALFAEGAVGVSVERVRRRTLDSLFDAHPDGWAAFFRAHRGAYGVVEVATPRYAGDRRTATVVVGRSCGEHCRQAWRVHLRRDDVGAWRQTAVDFLRVPAT
jgi:hypothetical protein